MKRALITGAGGFLGTAIVRLLHERGDVALRGFSRSEHPHLDDFGVEQRLGDLTDARAVQDAVEGCDLVFHVAARVGVWGPPEPFERVNVDGTRHLLEACRRHGVRDFIFTSSPSVVYTGQDLLHIDESAPYPDHFAGHYSRTKADAERLVLDAHDGDSLRTVSLRPHLLWGPGDNQFAPRVIARSRANRLVGLKAPDARIDPVFITDAARAHVLAADALDQHPETLGGKPYFISSGQPVGTWAMIDRFLAVAGQPPVQRFISVPAAKLLATLMEGAWRALPLPGEPPMTRWLVKEMATTRLFNIDAASRDFGYEPQVDFEQGMALFAKSLTP